jgi:hypothetical protein
VCCLVGSRLHSWTPRTHWHTCSISSLIYALQMAANSVWSVVHFFSLFFPFFQAALFLIFLPLSPPLGSHVEIWIQNSFMVQRPMSAAPSYHMDFASCWDSSSRCVSSILFVTSTNMSSRFKNHLKPVPSSSGCVARSMSLSLSLRTSPLCGTRCTNCSKYQGVTAEAWYQLGRLVERDGEGDVFAQSLGQA